jgi:hypothetical protein
MRHLLRKHQWHNGWGWLDEPTTLRHTFRGEYVVDIGAHRLGTCPGHHDNDPYT